VLIDSGWNSQSEGPSPFRAVAGQYSFSNHACISSNSSKHLLPTNDCNSAVVEFVDGSIPSLFASSSGDVGRGFGGWSSTLPSFKHCLSVFLGITYGEASIWYEVQITNWTEFANCLLTSTTGWLVYSILLLVNSTYTNNGLNGFRSFAFDNTPDTRWLILSRFHIYTSISPNPGRLLIAFQHKPILQSCQANPQVRWSPTPLTSFLLGKKCELASAS